MCPYSTYKDINKFIAHNGDAAMRRDIAQTIVLSRCDLKACKGKHTCTLCSVNDQHAHAISVSTVRKHVCGSASLRPHSEYAPRVSHTHTHLRCDDCESNCWWPTGQGARRPRRANGVAPNDMHTLTTVHGGDLCGRTRRRRPTTTTNAAVFPNVGYETL